MDPPAINVLLPSLAFHLFIFVRIKTGGLPIYAYMNKFEHHFSLI
jgi:hypothetical protein